MPYTINKYNGDQITVITDGTIDNRLDIKLIGKNYAGYGEVQNENFVFMLENFANSSPPPRPIAGQIWYDSANGKVKFYDGLKFRTIGGSETGTVEPSGLSVGDFWFDTTNNQFYVWDGSKYVLIGPQGIPGSATTQMRSRKVTDTLGNTHAIVEGVANGVTVFIISSDPVFTLKPGTDDITGFSKIHEGLTLIYTNNDDPSHIGETTSAHRFWGTATNAERLGGYTEADFIRTGDATFTGVVAFGDDGFTVGSTNPPKLLIKNESAETPIFRNQAGGTMKFQTTVNSTTRTPLQLVDLNVRPGEDNVTDLGTVSYKFKKVYAYDFEGTASLANKMVVNTELSPAPATASEYQSSGTVVVRTSTQQTINSTVIPAGAIKGSFFVGTATSANYADLAEKYLPDADYEVGTVMVVGGEKEITASSYSQRAIGVISENPAYMMNSELEGGVYVALKGRVPVKVSGPVKKGDKLVASYDGTAVIASPVDSNVFAIALESSDDLGVKLVECVIL